MLLVYCCFNKGVKIVVVGGGMGLLIFLWGLKYYSVNIIVIVIVVDDGGFFGCL